MDHPALPPSQAVHDMVELPTPCGRHVVYYPGQLARWAVGEQRYHVFMTRCECGTAYLVATQPDGAHFRRESSPVTISQLYEAIPWPESAILDQQGVFHMKEAPSLDVLLAHFARRD